MSEKSYIDGLKHAREIVKAHLQELTDLAMRSTTKTLTVSTAPEIYQHMVSLSIINHKLTYVIIEAEKDE